MHSRFLPCSRRRPRRRRNAGSRCKRRPGRRVRKAAGGKNEHSLPPVFRRSRRDLRRPALKQKRSPPLHDPQTGRSRPGHSAACLCPHRGKPLLWLDGCCKPYWEWTSFPRGNTVLLPGSPAKLPHAFFENPMACAPYSVNLMGARTRRHASAMDAVPHPLPSVMFPTVPGLSGVMPAKEIPLSDIVVWYTCPASSARAAARALYCSHKAARAAPSCVRAARRAACSAAATLMALASRTGVWHRRCKTGGRSAAATPSGMAMSGERLLNAS